MLARVFPPRIGGIEHHVYELYTRLAARFDVRVLTPDWPDARGFDQTQCVAIVRTPVLCLAASGHIGALLGMLLFGLREILLRRPDQIHCDQIDAAIAGRLLAWAARTRYVVHAYAMEIADGSHTAAKRWAADRADAVICISEHSRRLVMDHWQVPSSRIQVVHPGVDTERFCPSRSNGRTRAKYGSCTDKIILTVGRLAGRERDKGHRMIIRCLPRVLAAVPDALYIIAGDGPDRPYLEEMARTCGVANRVVFLGLVPHDELPDLYANCDVFAMPSAAATGVHGGLITEGFGMVFLEASASGIPVLGSRSGGIPDAVADGVTGFLVDPASECELVTALVTLLRDEETSRQLGAAGRRWTLQQFQWDASADKLASVVAELLGRA